MERLVFYLVSKGETISHTIPDYGVVVEKGLADSSEQPRKRRISPERVRNKRTFIRASNWLSTAL